MDKLSEGFILLLNDLKHEGGLEIEDGLDLLKRIKDGKETKEDEQVFDKINDQ